MMDRSRPFRSLRLTWALLLVGLLGTSGPAEGVGVAGKLLWELGKKVGAFAVEYLATKVADQALGLSYEKQLKQVEANLVAEIRKNPGNSHALQVELESARSQIRVLNAVLTSKSSAAEVAGLRSRMESDLQQVKRLLEQQGVRLDQHDQKLAEHDETLEELDSRIDRLEEDQDRSFRFEGMEERETLPVWREPADDFSPREEDVPEWRSRVRREEPSFETREPRYREPTVSPRGEGITLTIEVRCSSCTVEVRETDSARAADHGFFQVRGARERRSFRLLAGTGAVITILGDNNRIRIPAGVGRIRVRDLGENNRKLDMK